MEKLTYAPDPLIYKSMREILDAPNPEAFKCLQELTKQLEKVSQAHPIEPVICDYITTMNQNNLILYPPNSSYLNPIKITKIK